VTPRVLAALTSGLLLALISAPINLHWLHWLSFVPLFWALRPGEHGRNAMLGWIAGYAGVSTCFFWIAESVVRFSNLPSPIALVIIHLFAFAWGLPYAIVFGAVQPLRRRLGTWWVLVVPALLVTVEHWGPQLFPYYQGVSQFKNPWTFQLASVTGVKGVSFLLLFTNACAAEAVYRWREGRGIAPGAIAAGFAVGLGNLGFGVWRTAAVDAEVATWPTARLTQMQLSITMEERMRGTARQAMLDWVRVSNLVPRDGADLVVWPEGATPYDPRGAGVRRLMKNVARRVNAPILFGGGYAEPTTDPETGREYVEQRNSVYLMAPNGIIVDRYDKNVPLAFGEYLPFADTFPILRELIQGPGNFKAGTEAVVFEAETASGSVRFATPICYEAILADFVREKMSDVDLLLVVTNDGWFGDTFAPHQHGMLSAVRSTELGIPMFRLAYTGVSFVVLPNGRYEHETGVYEEVNRVLEVPYGRVPTIYSRVGDLFPWLCTLGVLIAVLCARRVTPDAPPS